MSLPFIGISCSLEKEVTERGSVEKHFIYASYINAVISAGGIPVVLPNLPEKCAGILYKEIDGLLLSGGGDIEPFFYAREPKYEILKNVTVVRDCFELSLAKIALSSNLPILGICRGIQVLNVAGGGTLYQDIDSEAPPQNQPKHHRQEEPSYLPTHLVEIMGSSLLAKIHQTRTLSVNSFHHQAVREVGSIFKVSAVSLDGFIEGIESKKHHFVLGLQWHPENMWERNPLYLKPFQALIQAGKIYAKKRKTLRK